MEWSCMLCKNDVPRVFLEGKIGLDNKHYNLMECVNCMAISVWPMPNDHYLNEFYSLRYDGRVKSNIIVSADFRGNEAAIEDCYKKHQYISKFSGINGGRLLDVGCGHGFFLYASKKLGYDSAGLDIDKDAVAWGKEILGVEIMEESIEHLSNLPNNSFDVVTFWQVLEHLKTPYKSLKSANNILKPGGILAGSVPNIGGIGFKLQGKKWYLLVPPEHLHYFHDNSLRKVIEEAGFDPLFVGTVPLYATPYFTLGIRSRLMKLAQNTEFRPAKFILMKTYRLLTLIKRYVVFYPLNNIIMFFRIKGNSLFFVGKKPLSIE